MSEFGVKCNVRAPHRYMRFGALCTIANFNGGGGCDHVEVWGMTRGGRMTRTWMDTRDLGAFRAAWIPENIRKHCYRLFSTKEEAAEWADSLQVRYGNTAMRDLRPDKDGPPPTP